MSRFVPRIPRWVKAVYLAGVVAVLGWAVADSLSQFGQWRGLFRQSSTYVFMASWAGMALLLGAWWALLLRWRFDVRLTMREWLPIQAMAWGGRYLPGKLGLLAGKFALLGRGGMDARRVACSVLWEQLAFVLSAVVAAALFLTAPIAGSPEVLATHWNAFRALAGIGSLVAFFLLESGLGRIWPDARSTDSRFGIGKQAALFALYLVPHLIVGIGCYWLLCAMIPAAASLGATGMIGLLALANMAGILALFAPAGMGVREAVLGLGLSVYAPLPVVLAFAAVLRLLSFVADAGFFLSAGGFALLCRRQSPLLR